MLKAHTANAAASRDFFIALTWLGQPERTDSQKPNAECSRDGPLRIDKHAAAIPASADATGSVKIAARTS